MHELAIVQEIISIASAAARGAQVRKISLEIGKLSMVMPDAVRFAFELSREDTPLRRAELEILEPPGEARCRSCAKTFILDRPYGQCRCGATDLEWLSGEQLEIKSLEIF